LPDEQKKKLCASLATLRSPPFSRRGEEHKFCGSLVALRSPKSFNVLRNLNDFAKFGMLVAIIFKGYGRMGTILTRTNYNDEREGGDERKQMVYKEVYDKVINMSVKSWFDGLNIWIKIVMIIALIIFYPVGIIFLIVYLISWAINSNKSKSVIEKLQDYIEQKDKLKEAKSRLILHRDEKVLYSQFSDFHEERAVRNYVRSGHSFRIMKGWWYHMGSGQAESHGELRRIDSGILYITSKRFIFNGTFKNYNYNNNKLVSVEPFSDAIRIAVDGRQKTLTFTSDNPILLGASMQILQENPALEKEAKEYIENELKRKIAEKIKIIEGNLSFNVETYEDMAQIFTLLANCIKLDIDDYSNILNKTPTEVISFKSKVDALTKILDSYDKELKKIKVKLGDSVKKEELQAEFDKVVDKKYGEHTVTDSMQDLTKSMTSLGIGEMTVTVKENKKK